MTKISEQVVASFVHVEDFFYKCFLCDAVIKEQSSGYMKRKSHFINKHTDCKPVQCPKCNKQYKNVYSLSAHMGQPH